MDGKIRAFQKTDSAGVLKLIVMMAEYHHSLDGYYKNSEEYINSFEDLEGEIAAWAEEKNTKVWVAEDDEKVIGYLRAGIEESPVYTAPARIGVIYDVFVLESYRQEGVASHLFDESLKWFEAKRIRNIELSIDIRNWQGLILWKKFGFKDYKLRLRKDL